MRNLIIVAAIAAMPACAPEEPWVVVASNNSGNSQVWVRYNEKTGAAQWCRAARDRNGDAEDEPTRDYRVSCFRFPPP